MNRTTSSIRGVIVRLWSLHPQHLDSRGLVAVWREGLLARAVLRGETRGYQHHPQLIRFKRHAHPLIAMDAFLTRVWWEANARGYRFDASKITPVNECEPVPVSSDQVEYEWQHLLTKLARRDPAKWLLERTKRATPHPLFQVQEGEIESWEKVN